MTPAPRAYPPLGGRPGHRGLQNSSVHIRVIHTPRRCGSWSRPASSDKPTARSGYLLDLVLFSGFGGASRPAHGACSLGFRGDPDGDPNGPDFVDVYGVRFHPFAITPLLFSVHVIFKPGDTSFTSTGTHHVDPSGRLLPSSSYRWAKDEGPGDSSYVSRVDQCLSS